MRTWNTTPYRFPTPLLALLVAVVIACAPLIGTQPAHAQGGTTHTVQAGENLFRIALRYNLTVEFLAASNNITDPTRIWAGQVLTIPDPNAPAPGAPVDNAPAPVENPPAAPAVNPAPVTSTAPVYHTVQVGETLASIARTYGISWPELAATNGITNPNHIFSGQQIMVSRTGAPGTAAVALPVDSNPAPNPIQPAVAPSTRTHVVQAGEHLAAIARIYTISWPTIARANNITDPNQIYVGQALVIPATDDGQGGYAQPASVAAPAAALPTITTGKQIVVDLSDQRVYAYENGQLLRNVLVSTGTWQYPTVQGDYRVYLKYDSQTMSGPGYYLPGVPWVMYFYKGYSLHGTYWHSNFGTPMSHGCVNLPTPEASWFYQWAEIGTPVHVQA